MQTLLRTIPLLALSLLLAACAATPAPALPPAGTPARILVFNRTAGFRHDSIPVGMQAVRELATQAGVDSEHSEDAALFDDASLARFHAVIFLSTTGDVLDAAQQAALERFVARGGGYLGIHAAADTEYDWPWYGELVGAWFLGHPQGLQTTRVRFEGDQARLHRGAWRVTDELYNYRRNPRARAQVLATVDEGDYAGGSMGGDHPIAWCHAQAGGRAWYTGLGHDAGLYADPVYRAHLLRGLRYVTGQSDKC